MDMNSCNKDLCTDCTDKDYMNYIEYIDRDYNLDLVLFQSKIDILKFSTQKPKSIKF